MFVRATTRVFDRCIREEGEVFEVADNAGESPNYVILTKKESKALGLIPAAEIEPDPPYVAQ